MVPALATIIGVYVIFRMFETMFFSTARYAGKAQHIIVGIFAGLVVVIVFFTLVDIWNAASRPGAIPKF
jgi:hypothetical protein